MWAVSTDGGRSSTEIDRRSISRRDQPCGLRSSPGLVLTAYNLWVLASGPPHFERPGHYHATFYRQVEALSVTPYSTGASRQEGLTGGDGERQLAGIFDLNRNVAAQQMQVVVANLPWCRPRWHRYLCGPRKPVRAAPSSKTMCGRRYSNASMMKVAGLGPCE